MCNIYCLPFIYHCSTDYTEVTLAYCYCFKCIIVLHRKKVFNKVQHFLHLNLSLALLLGLATFVSGIETASEYRVSDTAMF